MATGASEPGESLPAGNAEAAGESPTCDHQARIAGLDIQLENRVLALDARVQALETTSAKNADASRRLKELAGNVAAAHFRFKGDLISLIDDHIEILKLVQVMARHYEGDTNKVIFNYIRNAEGRLELFQERFAEMDAAGERLKNGSLGQGLDDPRLMPAYSALNIIPAELAKSAFVLSQVQNGSNPEDEKVRRAATG